MAASGVSLCSDELIIEEIKKYPYMYDPRLKEYRDKVKKEMTWMKISQILCIKVDSLKYRWKCLRDRYVRERKALKEAARSGANTSYFPKSSLQDELAFLNDTICHRKSIASMEIGDIEPEVELSIGSESFMPEPVEEENVMEEQTNYEMIEKMPDQIPKLARKEVDKKFSTFLDVAIERLKGGKLKTSSDEHFLLSLVDDFGKVPEGKKKLELKSKILSLISEYVE